jgi:hypothetical protein
MKLYNLFERVFVINLARRPERWSTFCKYLPCDWPFVSPQRYEALDGEVVTPPHWWHGGRGAWGCYKTHVRILEDCLNQNYQSVLILEDDAVCIKGFTAKVQQFFDAVPGDWSLIYLGGQHLEEDQRLPRKVNDWVYRPFNVNRCHCYGFRGRQIIEQVYRHLHNFQDWKVSHHVDHYLGELHKRTEKGCYVPKEWLVGQNEGMSDICGKKLEVRIFPSSEETLTPPMDIPGIAVMGGYFSGINVIAGALHFLGVSLGTEMKYSNDAKAINYFEDATLGTICRHSYEEPFMNEKLEFQDRVNHLRRWGGLQCKDKSKKHSYFCGKHPILSLMGLELLEAWKNPYFVCVDRPDAESVQTMSLLPWGWSSRATSYALNYLRESRECFFKKYQPRLFRINFSEVISSPEKVLDGLCDFLGYVPSEIQKTKTIQFIRQCQNDLPYGSYLDFSDTVNSSVCSNSVTQR